MLKNKNWGGHVSVFLDKFGLFIYSSNVFERFPYSKDESGWITEGGRTTYEYGVNLEVLSTDCEEGVDYVFLRLKFRCFKAYFHRCWKWAFLFFGPRQSHLGPLVYIKRWACSL